MGGKVRAGYVFEDKNGQWCARMTYTDAAGKRRNLKRVVGNITEAKQMLKELGIPINRN